VVCFCSILPWLRAQQAADSTISPDDPVGYELNLMNELHSRSAQDVGDSILPLLRDPGAPREVLRGGRGALLARRAAVLCGWLCNDNKYDRAIAVGTVAMRLLNNFTQITTAEDVERAYWQSVILGRVLNRPDEAVALLESARLVAPDDKRLLELEFQLIPPPTAPVTNGEEGSAQ